MQAERARYRDLSATLDLRRVKCMDESGINIAMTRLYGRAPQNSGQNVTILGALACTGLEAVMTSEGATDATGGRHCHRRPPLGPQGRGGSTCRHTRPT